MATITATTLYGETTPAHLAMNLGRTLSTLAAQSRALTRRALRCVGVIGEPHDGGFVLLTNLVEAIERTELVMKQALCE